MGGESIKPIRKRIHVYFLMTTYHAKDGKIFIRANMLIQKMLNIVTVTKMVKIDCKSKVGKNSILVKKKTRTINPKDKVVSQII